MHCKKMEKKIQILGLTSLGNRIAKCLSKDSATVISTEPHKDTLAKASKISRIRAKIGIRAERCNNKTTYTGIL